MINVLSVVRRSLSKMTSVAPKDVQENIRLVIDRINSAYQNVAEDYKPLVTPRLVAVSKTKPLELIKACYDVGQRTFGENYLQELIEKSQSDFLVQNCPEIRWHYIGVIQSNKMTKLVNSVPGLSMVETISSAKHAKLLDATCKSSPSFAEKSLAVMVQVNTSGEGQKSGLQPNEAIDLAELIIDTCSSLQFRGFMTIGALEHSVQGGCENPDFRSLVDTRSRFCSRRFVEPTEVELSMGMSNDFEDAIRMGSTNVRVGSTIFGPRQYSN